MSAQTILHRTRLHFRWACLALLLAAGARSAGGQVPSRVRDPLPQRGSLPASRLLLYNSLLGDQPDGIITYYTLVRPMLRQEAESQRQQQEIERLQRQLDQVRSQQSAAMAVPARPRVLPPGVMRTPQPELGQRRPAAGFMRHSRYYPVP